MTWSSPTAAGGSARNRPSTATVPHSRMQMTKPRKGTSKGSPKDLPPGPGRPKGSKDKYPRHNPNSNELRDVQAYCKQFTVEATDMLIHMMRTAKSEFARIAAAREILDRAVGRP